MPKGGRLERSGQSEEEVSKGPLLSEPSVPRESPGGLKLLKIYRPQTYPSLVGLPSLGGNTPCKMGVNGNARKRNICT